MPKVIPSEHQEQVSYISWFKRQYPKYAKAIFSNPNGADISGHSTKGLSIKTVKAIKMNKMKKEGFKPGVSDVQLTVSRGGYHGLWVEMKRSNGKEKDVSDDQAAHIELMQELGHMAEWAAGADEAIKITKKYMTLK